MKLSSRMEAVAQRVNQALVMGKVTKSMQKTVTGMDAAFKSMNVEKISKVMDQFTAAFDEVDVKTSVMGQELDRTMDSTVQSDDVTNLMQMVADEHGLTLSDNLKSAPKSSIASQLEINEEDQLGERLRNLG
ncbi:hypothetical protein BASA81_001313 [Batrachochytrium salamandrivorans]|nr:hypothetical protein BASA81_001313 [Batrachochytrium salamandrivorans]